jgi:RNA polymerase sigma-70 factor (ECF subfamily)
MSAEVSGVVERALADLPERQRVVVALRDVQGYDAAEVCDLLGVSQGNQRILLHRGRAKVRQVLESYLAGASQV